MARGYKRKNPTLYNVYDFQDGKVCFITTCDREFAMEPDENLVAFLKKINDNKGSLLEYELIALNRWLMGKGFDLTHSRSRVSRSITLTDNLKQFLL